ncbi:MAG: UDP-N-acetylmuramoyl-L-alanyl-D-glutamate--2,6-diaminopimelate ligase [Paracoccaceae bacterium]
MGKTKKPLSDLGLLARGGANPPISGVAVDSRLVEPGTLFGAMPGSRMHGGSFIEYALRMGAAAILTDAEGAEIAAEALDASQAALVITDEPRAALSRAAALWFGAQPETMIAVTGTNGKTSVSTFVRQIWIELGLRAVNLGTTGVEGAWSAPLSHTTPEPITLHRLLAQAQQADITHAAMEASSHGLDQRRLDGVMLQAAGFTNLSQDHLDYHDTFEEYLHAKAGLFTRVLPAHATAVINLDGAHGSEMAAIARTRGQELLTVGRGENVDVRLDGQRFDATGQDIRFTVAHHGSFTTRLNLIGGFQAENILLAIGLVMACGEEVDQIAAILGNLRTVRGRMQLAATRENGAAVFIDYAHTPDAVETALKAMRPHVLGRLIAVVGAGGDRDKSKRPLMGAAAAQHADVVFVTDDNPRSEDPAIIRAAVMQGCPDATEIPDRAEAILRAVDALQPGDALLVAGKGHETGQVVGDDVFPFDDAEQASIAVSALDGTSI